MTSVKKMCARVLLLGSVGLLPGCATMISGKTVELTVFSEPEGAHVWVNKRYVGDTPVSWTANRRRHQRIHVEKEGYEHWDKRLSPKFNGVVFVNVANGFFPGYIVDGLTGADGSFWTKEVRAELEKLNEVESE